MRKFWITVLLTATLLCSLPFYFAKDKGDGGATTEYLRLHIRADSNGEKDQAVKYLVRDKIVDYLTPVVANFESKRQAERGLKRILPSLEDVAKSVLKEQGFSYGARAEIKKETFPTRIYGDEVFPAGEYDALLIYLGSGQGENWWCVLYPPLCFSSASGKNIEYRSIILKRIEQFKSRRKKR